MAELESKLATLRDGAEAVACVLQNWEGVLSAISMASTRAASTLATAGKSNGTSLEPELPVTLVRIPVGDTDGGKQQPPT
jgi:DASH complex subunit DAD2